MLNLVNFFLNLFYSKNREIIEKAIISIVALAWFSSKIVFQAIMLEMQGKCEKSLPETAQHTECF